MDYIDSIDDKHVTYATTATLHALGNSKPYLTFLLPAELSQYYTPMECAVSVPETIEWPYMSFGEFAVDAIITLDTNTMEIVRIDDLRPNPSLAGGF